MEISPQATAVRGASQCVPAWCRGGRSRLPRGREIRLTRGPGTQLRRRTPLALAALCGFALAAGCGGSGSDFREQAEAICTDYDERIGEIPAPQTNADLADTAGEIADLTEAQLAELRELDPPDDVAARFGEWLELGEEAVENAREIQEAAEADDLERINELAGAAERNELDADRIARDLDLRACMIEQDAPGEQDGDDAPTVTVGTGSGP